MSDEKKARDLNNIQQDYQQTCVRLGHIEYQIDALEQDAKMIKSTLRDLNFEAASAQRAEAEKKAAEQPKAEEGAQS